MTTPPSTGVAALDQALAQLSDVEQHPVAEQYALLDQAQQVLQAVLHGTGSGAGTSARNPRTEAADVEPR